jgi:hypothetical protein
METSKYWLGLCGAFLLLGGCAGAPFKPAGLTDRDISRKMGDLKYTCESLRMGTPVQVKFYSDEGIDPRQTVSGGTLNGYLYACNKWNNTIWVSPKPLRMLSRGTPYYLKYVEEIKPIQETAMLPAELNEAASSGILSLDPTETHVSLQK